MIVRVREYRAAVSAVAAGIVICLGAVSLLSMDSIVTASEVKMEEYAQYNGDGELLLPKGYRAWPYIGTPLTPNDMNNGSAAFPEFHSVYMDPKSWKAYEETGEFPDGTVLVKELVSVGSKSASSGNGYFMGDFNGLEVALKDRKRFADEPGYWAYFRFTNEDLSLPYKKTAAALSAESCNTCHSATAEQDWVFTQYYPVLRAMRDGAKESSMR